MSARSTSKQAKRESPYPVLDYDGFGPPPPLPDGHGAVWVFTWCGKVARKYSLGPLVGVDGQQTSFGYGRVLIVLPAGEHLLEVQSVSSMRTMRVTVEPGQIVPVEYVSAANDHSPGAIGNGPQRPPGRAYSPAGYAWLSVGMFVIYGVGLWMVNSFGWHSGGVAAIVTMITLLLSVLAGNGVYRLQQRPDRPPDPPFNPRQAR